MIFGITFQNGTTHFFLYSIALLSACCVFVFLFFIYRTAIGKKRKGELSESREKLSEEVRGGMKELNEKLQNVERQLGGLRDRLDENPKKDIDIYGPRRRTFWIVVHDSELNRKMSSCFFLRIATSTNLGFLTIPSGTYICTTLNSVRIRGKNDNRSSVFPRRRSILIIDPKTGFSLPIKCTKVYYNSECPILKYQSAPTTCFGDFVLISFQENRASLPSSPVKKKRVIRKARSAPNTPEKRLDSSQLKGYSTVTQLIDSSFLLRIGKLEIEPFMFRELGRGGSIVREEIYGTAALVPGNVLVSGRLISELCDERSEKKRAVNRVHLGKLSGCERSIPGVPYVRKKDGFVIGVHLGIRKMKMKPRKSKMNIITDFILHQYELEMMMKCKVCKVVKEEEGEEEGEEEIEKDEKRKVLVRKRFFEGLMSCLPKPKSSTKKIIFCQENEFSEKVFPSLEIKKKKILEKKEAIRKMVNLRCGQNIVKEFVRSHEDEPHSLKKGSGGDTPASPFWGVVISVEDGMKGLDSFFEIPME